MANDFFSHLGKTLTDTAKNVGEKTDEFISVQKLRSQQSSLESKINKDYKLIGELVYQKYVNGEPYSEDLAALCREIMQTQSDITDLKDKIADRKGQTICPVCGAAVPKDADYCMKCGSPIPMQDAEYAHYEEAFSEEPDEKEESADTTFDEKSDAGEVKLDDKAEETGKEE
ncbi:zinc ribbon domain-containing protein [Blautia liquoris]|uniref:Zinc ribbon domain-containing protein n=1 Tax=Blautia liquoris TaxID=2779518 RepID=A0A7M2RIM5_9FIRM|nr:zinc ribbon domain-containing protein [Blautia liquoris]QOV20109.1 zinc ribbon domain-containing protein [Blautia liquoris]